MTKNDFIKEHKQLIKILTSGDRLSQVKEAKKQKAELLSLLKRNSSKTLQIKALI